MKPLNRPQITRLLDQLTGAVQAQDLRLQQVLLHELVHHSDMVVRLLIRFLREPDKERWQPAMFVLAQLGYPQNVQALPVAFYHIGDINSLAWPEAKELLGALPAGLLAQHLIAQVWSNMKSKARWKWTAGEVFSTALHVSEDFPVQDIEPLVVYIIGQSRLRQLLIKPELLLEVVNAGGHDSRKYAVPALLQAIKEAPESPFAIRAEELIAMLPSATLAPYRLIR